jgi:signal transduction histidine kinase
MSSLRRALIALGGAALAAGLVTIPLVLGSSHTPDRGIMLGSQLVIGWSFAGVGLFAWWRRPTSWVGALMTAFGLTWLLSSLYAANDGHLIVMGALVMALPYGFLVLMLLSFPDRRLHSRFERWLMLGVWFSVTVLQWLPLLFTQWNRYAGCGACPHNPLLVSDNRALAVSLADVQAAVSLALVASLIIALAIRWRTLDPARRPALFPLLFTGTTALAVLASAFGAMLGGGQESSAVTTVFRIGLIPLALVPYSFLVGLLQSRFTRAGAVSELVARLSERTEDGGGLRDALASAFGDPSLILAYWIPERRHYVDAEGHPVELPDGSGDRDWIPVERDGAPVAAIIHDASLAEERRLLEVAGAAAALALENERLDAELRARVEELQRSRARIIEAGLDERRKLERNLHDGAQQRLVSLALSMRLARDRIERDPEGARALLDESMHELDSATAELRELARGIHPAVLSDRGLPAALKALTGRVPLPVELIETPAARLPARVEIASYYVVAEALTNIAKYAQASRAQVRVSQVNGSVTVEVSDDGVGGANPVRGSGLRGLADRVAALDGRLEVDSRAGCGTIVTAQIPCA